MYQKIAELSAGVQNKIRDQRRDFHKYAETGWLEMRTSSIIARRLTDLGCYEVLVGKDVCDADARMGLPDQDVLDKQYERAVAQGGDPEFLPYTKGGFTGVIGILRCGEGPVVALRFDIDALGVIESEEQTHFPKREGFSSVNYGFMHACGHDGHASIGLGVAEVLANIKDSLHGTIKLIFQPAEEGVRGAKSIVAKGHLDDVDYVIGNHIGAPKGVYEGVDFLPGSGGNLATTKLDVYYYGASAHASGSPHVGKNALQAAAAAIMNLYSIPRHGDGASRINVGTIHAGTGRNVIADIAKMEMEVRGKTTEIKDYMEEHARAIIKACAEMYDCTYEIKVMGGAQTAESDPALMDRVQNIIKEHMPEYVVKEYIPQPGGGSEDYTYMMQRVQQNGGQATFMRSLCACAGPGHSRIYDFDEVVLSRAVRVFSSVVYDILK
ncbi:MAG: amidohydrolase [Clostridiaceae bacterium]|nr:amidohydrolase [Clostridiaceae bacterium]